VKFGCAIFAHEFSRVPQTGDLMFDDNEINAIKTGIRANELGPISPYQLSFARKGASGASFGVFQGDMHANPSVRDVFANVLKAASADAATIARLSAVLSAPCPNGNPLSAADTATCNGALSGPGRSLVDAMDDTLMQTVLAHVQQAVDAAGARHFSIADVALIDIALWSNMTGAPDTMCKWIGGQTTMDLPPPKGPVVAQSDIETYLGKTAYFQANPKNFDHFKQSVAAGAAVLNSPAGQAVA
jgi:hypothetical protein